MLNQESTRRLWKSHWLWREPRGAWSGVSSKAWNIVPSYTSPGPDLRSFSFVTAEKRLQRDCYQSGPDMFLLLRSETEFPVLLFLWAVGSGENVYFRKSCFQEVVHHLKTITNCWYGFGLEIHLCLSTVGDSLFFLEKLHYLGKQAWISSRWNIKANVRFNKAVEFLLYWEISI